MPRARPPRPASGPRLGGGGGADNGQANVGGHDVMEASGVARVTQWSPRAEKKQREKVGVVEQEANRGRR